MPGPAGRDPSPVSTPSRRRWAGPPTTQGLGGQCRTVDGRSRGQVSGALPAVRSAVRHDVIGCSRSAAMTPSSSQPSRLEAVKAEVTRRAMDHAPGGPQGRRRQRRRCRAVPPASGMGLSSVVEPMAFDGGTAQRRAPRHPGPTDPRDHWSRLDPLAVLRSQICRIDHERSRAPSGSREEGSAVHIADIVIGDRRKLRHYYTGGTTGKSVVVYGSADSDGERFARQEAMWAMHGYQLRLATASLGSPDAI